ncbi:hypothetical protein AGMMS49593_08270 [Endomicrobiia bacterium]|nr:hypothetical protein AGMMS49593_08270 [Endomicrobiia bacterium]
MLALPAAASTDGDGILGDVGVVVISENVDTIFGGFSNGGGDDDGGVGNFSKFVFDEGGDAEGDVVESGD